MKVLLTGASGFIGRVTRQRLAGAGHTVIPLVRRTPSIGEAFWDPAQGRLEAAAVEGCEAVVHLAGENAASQRRWNPAHKNRMFQSRVDGTRLLAGTLARMARPPRVWVCASATGYYGHRGDEWLDEASAPGRGFLAGLCQAWEAAADPARAAGVRVVHLRIGAVLGRDAGA